MPRDRSLARAVALTAVLAFATGLAACADDDSDDGRSLAVGYAYGFDVGDTADRIAFDRVAENTDVDPRLEETAGGAEAIAALTRGEIDMAKVALGDALNAIAQGADLRIILSGNPAFDQLLVGQPEVESVADLRDRKILVEPGVAEELVRLALEDEGLEEGEYEIGHLPDSHSRSAALAAGQADAANLESVDLELTGSGRGLNRLADVGAILPEPATVFIVRRDFAEENPEVLEETVTELLAGFESLYGRGGRDQWVARARSEELAGEPEEVAGRIYDSHRKLGYWTRGAPVTEAEHDAATDFLIQAGVVKEPVPYEDAWDPSFWSQAAQDHSEGARSLTVGYSYGFDAGDTSDRVAFDRMTGETGIQLDFEEMGGGQEAIAALVGGDIEMAKVTFWDAVNAIGQGADIRMILSVNPHFDLVLAGRPEIQRLSDLRGGLVISEGPPPKPSDINVRRALEQAGLDEGDYELQFLSDSQDRLAGLLSGRADAALLESTDMELTRDELELNRLTDIGAQVPGPNNALAVTTDFAEQNQELLEDAVRGMLVGFEELYGPGGREAWVTKAREGTLAEEPEEVPARIYEGHRRLGYWPRGGPLTEAVHQEAVEALAAAGVVRKPVPFEEAWDISFWSDAADGG